MGSWGNILWARCKSISGHFNSLLSERWAIQERIQLISPILTSPMVIELDSLICIKLIQKIEEHFTPVKTITKEVLKLASLWWRFKLLDILSAPIIGWPMA